MFLERRVRRAEIATQQRVVAIESGAELPAHVARILRREPQGLLGNLEHPHLGVVKNAVGHRHAVEDLEHVVAKVAAPSDELAELHSKLPQRVF